MSQAELNNELFDNKIILKGMGNTVTLPMPILKGSKSEGINGGNRMR